MGPFRSLWRAVISFGLVSIPVKVYAASEDRDVHLRQLHRRCHTPIQYRKWCPTCQLHLEADDIQWGYELAPGRFVTVEERELEQLPLPEPHVIQILDFVRLPEVDPVYFERPYYLEPAEAAGRAYRLLAGAMGETGRVAIARLAIRRKEALGALRSAGGVLTLLTMRYGDEVRNPAEVVDTGQATEPTPREREMAIQLIERLTAPFDPHRYASQRRQALAELLERKAAGEPPVAAPAPQATPIADLVEALRASLAQVGGDGATPADGRAQGAGGKGGGAPGSDRPPAAGGRRRARSPAR